jgi:hypothetical protein
VNSEEEGEDAMGGEGAPCCSRSQEEPGGRRAMGEGATSMEEEPSSSLQPWEEGLPALACVQGEEGRKMLWRLKEMEGWECKVAKSKGRGTLFIEGALGLGFP